MREILEGAAAAIAARHASEFDVETLRRRAGAGAARGDEAGIGG